MDRVTYLGHSGFAVELPSAILVFDCSTDSSHSLKKMFEKASGKPVVFFVSHYFRRHGDTAIYEMAQNHRRYYVVSNDVDAMSIPSGLDVQGMSPGDYFEDIPGVKSVKAYKTTAKGVCYYVETADGPTIFHAGDLNDWQDEPDKRAQQKESAEFTTIVNRIAEEHPAVDVAFFPVDVRQGDDFARGAREFLKAVKVTDFFPMHFDGDYKEACNAESYITPDTTCHCMHDPGQSIDISRR